MVRSSALAALAALAVTLGTPVAATASEAGAPLPEYHAGGRPDPFEAPGVVERPEPCLEARPRIDELEISGVFILPESRVAQARAGARDFLLHEGDRLCDGELAVVSAEQVLLKTLRRPDRLLELGAPGQRGSCSWLSTPGGKRLSCASDLITLSSHH